VLPVLILTLPLAACSWGIRLDAGGEKVRTAWNDNVSACRSVGTITVSVLDHVGPLDRNSLKVRDELEVMARNEAVGLGADTIKPQGEPRDGQQTWGAWHCGLAAAAGRPGMRIEQKDAEGAAETYPIRN
jgi:hypothetical protein